MDLPLDDHRIDDVAEIVDRRPALDRRHARRGVDLDLADMDPGREGEVGRVVERPFLQPRLQLLPVELVRDIGLQGAGAEIELAVGALHREMPVGEIDIGLVRLQHMGGDLLALGDHLVERLEDRRHADRAGARAIGAHAHLHLVGVAMNDRDIVDRNAETIRDELGEGRLVTLAVAVRAGENLDRADRIDPDLGRFPQADTRTERTHRCRGGDAAGLDIGGEADAAQLAGAA